MATEVLTCTSPESGTAEACGSSKEAYSYDVFLCYSDSDEAWIVEKLVPRLEQTKVNYIDKTGQILGVSKLLERERCVVESRWTVLILSQSYLDDTWEMNDALLSESYGLDKGRWRTIPVRIEPNLKLPGRLENLVSIDLSSRNEREWVRLLNFLSKSGSETQGAVPSRAEAQSAKLGNAYAVSKALGVLVELLWEPKVREAIGAFRNDFGAACEQIDILGDYKALHDQLHQLQFDCFNIVGQMAMRFPDDSMTCEILVDQETVLEKILGKAREVASHAVVSPGVISWIKDLAQAHQHLCCANETLNADELERVIRLLTRILSMNPSRINDRLAETARVLRLPQLEKAMSAVRNVLEESSVDPEKVRIFDDGVKSLGSLKVGLDASIGEHDRWQEFDNELRLFETNLRDDPETLSDFWPDLEVKLVPLCDGDADWAVRLRAEAEALGNAIEAGAVPRIRQKFRSMRNKADLRFFEVDKALLRICEELRSVGQPLATILEIAG